MKLSLALALIVAASVVQAQEIHCYSGAREIYSGQGQIISWMDNFVEFQDTKTHQRIFTDAVCKVSISQKEMTHAINQRKKSKKH